jgi:archaellum component FlaC
MYEYRVFQSSFLAVPMASSISDEVTDGGGGGGFYNNLEMIEDDLVLMEDDLEMVEDDLEMLEDELEIVEDELEIMEDGQKCQDSFKLEPFRKVQFKPPNHEG